ncbi:hypothetical protein GQ53DRAFT_530935 [Thozetella sp. PMI_491]|nr:hypothetical protein GQ53DRAFT_530935 [Thozetella sp. PMI_491]
MQFLKKYAYLKQQHPPTVQCLHNTSSLQHQSPIVPRWWCQIRSSAQVSPLQAQGIFHDVLSLACAVIERSSASRTRSPQVVSDQRQGADNESGFRSVIGTWISLLGSFFVPRAFLVVSSRARGDQKCATAGSEPDIVIGFSGPAVLCSWPPLAFGEMVLAMGLIPGANQLSSASDPPHSISISLSCCHISKSFMSPGVEEAGLSESEPESESESASGSSPLVIDWECRASASPTRSWLSPEIQWSRSTPPSACSAIASRIPE